MTVAAISSKQWRDNMASEECEVITGVWGRAPGQGSGGQSPSEGERKLNFDNTVTRLILY